MLPSLGEEGQVAIRAVGSLSDEAAGTAGATTYDEPAVARIKGSSRMLHVLRKAARGALEQGGRPAPRQEGQLSFGEEPADGATAPAATPNRLRVVAFGARVELEADDLQRIRNNVLSGTAPSTCCARAPASCCSTPCGASPRGAAATPTRKLVAELRSSFDEDVSTETPFLEFLNAWWPELTPRRVLAAMSDERRLARWSRRILNQGEVRRLARS